MATDLDKLTEKVQQENQKFHQALEEMHRIIVGQKHVVQQLFVAILSDGHILLEGLPGLAKTLAVTTLAKVIQCDYKRIQFTPDLLPADLIGTSIYNPKEGAFQVSKGPIFTNILLADEINRAPAKVQSALLEVMQERQVTISGETFRTGSPFLVLATQNPIEHEGTYPLPEASTDRFMMKVKIDYPSQEEEREILRRMGVLGKPPAAKPVISGEDILRAREIINQIYLDEKVEQYILDVVFATRFPQKFGIPIQQHILYGASPRASLSLSLAGKTQAFLKGRSYVTPHDVKEICHDILRHRIRRTYEAEAEEISPDDLIDRILQAIPVP